jgi:5,5'-dehydrodivanillate O-demethylase
VGPGTPMGELMRRYWHPIAGSSALNDETPTKDVGLLGENLVLFRSAAGKIGLIEPSCPHRKANLSYGIPELEGIRCPYHGWLFDEQGDCVDQPSEPEGSRFKEKVHLKAYKMEELGGLIFAYMGSEPAPALPRYDILVLPGSRSAWAVELPCNGLQCQENSLDPIHFQWLHRYYGGWVMNRKMPPGERDAFNRATSSRGQDDRMIAFEKTDYGVIKRRLVGDETEEVEWWRIGHAVLFPNILRVVNNLQFRVPLDDTHTLHLVLEHQHAKDGERPDDYVSYTEHSVYDDKGSFRDDYVLG